MSLKEAEEQVQELGAQNPLANNRAQIEFRIDDLIKRPRSVLTQEEL